MRSLKIILLLTSIKLDASRKKFNQKVVDQILRGICDLASGIEAVERKYVKKGQRLLFCGPDLLQLAAKCIDLQHAFDALLQGIIHNSVIASLRELLSPISLKFLEFLTLLEVLNGLELRKIKRFKITLK